MRPIIGERGTRVYLRIAPKVDDLRILSNNINNNTILELSRR